MLNLGEIDSCSHAMLLLVPTKNRDFVLWTCEDQNMGTD